LPNYIRGAFHLADHWIRVHDEQKTQVKEHDPAWRSTLTPKHVYLREIVVDDKEKASVMRQRLVAGDSFFDLARANSVDRETGVNGGYMGDLEAGKMDPSWSAAALKLQPGEISNVVTEANGKYAIVGRMPRNFRYDAEVRFDKAIELRKEGKQMEARAELLESLKIYPHFLRALTYLGISLAETGNPGTGAQILSVATRLYPRDLGAHLNLALAYGAIGNDQEIPEYQRVLEIEPDYVAAYLNWGGALYNKGQYEEAIKLYRKAIAINPINASLHYSLSVALERVGRKQEAEAEMTLAGKIEPKYAAAGAPR
jgi:Flp pilus assembly protein TadD